MIKKANVFLLLLILSVSILLSSCGTDAISAQIDESLISAPSEAEASVTEDFETEPPVFETDAPETKAPETKAPETKAPETKAPETKAPETKAPETKAPETKAPETKTPETKAPETKAPETEAVKTIPADSSFWVKFLDVGQADAALVQCDDRYMLIDGGNKGDSDRMYAVLKSYGVKMLDLLVCSHPHEDHVGGLAGALNYAAAAITLCPVNSYDSNAFSDFKTYADRNGNGITVPAIGDTYELGSATVKILAANSSGDPNNSSILLKITYGETSFLFTGDNERDAEQVILNGDHAFELDATVLKVGHHGSSDATTYPFLREVMPQIAVISVGNDNSYGHPSDDTLSRLRDAEVKVYRTDLQGDILCTSDGKTVTVTVEKNPDADTLVSPEVMIYETGESETTISAVRNNGSTPQSEEGVYILNTSTRKVHLPTCGSVKQMKEKNREEYRGDPESLLEQGYEPCQKCKPFAAGVPVYETEEAETMASVERNNGSSTQAEEYDYILNTNTHKFHRPTCGSVKQMKDKNKKEYHGTREAVIDQGYDPCQKCNP